MSDNRVVHRRVALGVFVGVLVVAVGVVALLGGFDRRATNAVNVSLGSEIDNGQMIYLPESATVQYHPDSDTHPWEVIIYMKVRNPQPDPMEPIGTWSSTSIRGLDPATRLIAASNGFYLGTPPPDQDGFRQGDRYYVPPDNQWMDMQVQVYPDVSFQPGSGYMVAFRPLQYAQVYAFGYSSQEDWTVNSYARNITVALPLTRLPDAD